INCSCPDLYLHFLAHGTSDVVFWWPQPNTWDALGLNISFWSAHCEDWFQ
ncbi:hypothetical protein BDR06DRAFT_869720, partial [Suillus hirtellus]